MKSSKLTKKHITVALGLLLGGFFCLMVLGAIAFIRNNHLPPEYERIVLSEGPNDRRSEYLKLPLEKQVDMYGYMMVREPVDNRFTDWLASNGKAVVPVIMERLAREKTDYIKLCFIRVLRAMHQSYYKLSNEPQTVENLKALVAGINDRAYKEVAETQLEMIQAP